MFLFVEFWFCQTGRSSLFPKRQETVQEEEEVQKEERFRQATSNGSKERRNAITR